MGWLIALGILLLIAIIPVGASIFYDEDGFCALVIAGPVRIPVFPSRKKEKKEKPKKEVKEKKTKSAKKNAKPQKEQKKGGSITDFLPVLDKALDFLSAFRRKLRVSHLELKLILGGGDPSDLAYNYGRGWTLLGNLMPLLDNVLYIKKRDLEVECDFLADKTTVVAGVDISITIGRVLSLVFIQGIPILVEFFKVLNKRKGGAQA